MDVITFSVNQYTTSGLQILLHSVISLPDATSCDKSKYNHTLTIRQSMFGRKKGAEVLVLKELSHFEVLTV